MVATHQKAGGSSDPNEQPVEPKSFFSSITAVITFLIGTLLFNMVFGAKITRIMLILVLMSMLLLNAGKIKDVMVAIKGGS